MKVAWLNLDFLSYRRSADIFRLSLMEQGIDITTPEEADIVILQTLPWKVDELLVGFHMWKRPPILYTVTEHTFIWGSEKTALGLFPEIWTPSTFSQATLGEYHSNIKIIPHISERQEISEETLEKVKKYINYDPEVFYFYNFAKPSDVRKNHMGAKGAFRLALEKEKNAKFMSIPLYRYIEDDWLEALHSLFHCYISLHRSEGWGLCLSEALSYGNHVVSTSFGGCMDFLTEENSFLVPWEAYLGQFKDRPRDISLIQKRKWANPDIGVAKQKIRDVFSTKKSVVNEQGIEDMKKYSKENVGKMMVEALESYMERSF